MLFEIKDLYVKRGGRLILAVPHLVIPKGELIFILGNSGSGKTTMLETLGLMSNSNASEGEIRFFPDGESHSIHYRDIWQSDDEMAESRRRHFCFMFQETHLFPQLSVAENLHLPQIISDGATGDQIGQKTHEILTALEVSHHAASRINVMSGGERQRVAFARAVVTSGTVMFADEPTGNLGIEDSKNVLRNIRSFIRHAQGKNTAIVVTHNLDLALEFGDQIIVIQDNHWILPANIFTASGMEMADRRWSGLDGADPQKALLEKLKCNGDLPEKKNGHQTAEARSLPAGKAALRKKFNDSPFRKFMGDRLTQELSLKHKNNWLIIFFLAFVICAVGFSVGSLDVLEKKMKDPFIQWISIPLDMNSLTKRRAVEKYFSEDSVKAKYSLEAIGGYDQFPLDIYSPVKHGSMMFVGRSIGIGDDLLKAIMNPGNVVQAGSFVSEEDIGVVITDRMVRSMNLSVNDKFLYLIKGAEEYNETVKYPIPIRAIVKNLPGQSDFLCSRFFFEKWQTGGFSHQFTRTLAVYADVDSSGIDTLYMRMQSYFLTRYPDLDPFVTVQYDQIRNFVPNAQTGAVIRAAFLPFPQVPVPTWRDIRAMYAGYSAQYHDSLGNKMTFLYGYDDSKVSSLGNYSILSLNMRNLESVPLLHDDLKRMFGIEIDLASVKALENYQFVSRLTKTLSVVIIAISITAVCAFMGYILYLFLYRNRYYVGVLKAFGIPRRSLQRMFVRMSMDSLLTAFIVSSTISVVVGYSNMLKSIIGLWFRLEGEGSYFNLVSWASIILIISLAFFGYWSLRITASLILKKSPGDLLYDRLDDH